MASATANAPLPKATFLKKLGVVADVITPNLAKGVIIRRPRVVAMAGWMDLDRRAVKRMQQLRGKYGTGPLMLRLPVRNKSGSSAYRDPLRKLLVRRLVAARSFIFSAATSTARRLDAPFRASG